MSKSFIEAKNITFSQLNEEDKNWITEAEAELMIKTAVESIRTNGMHLKSISLGGSYTEELKADISGGTFNKAVVGGYLTINGHVYDFAHPDYWLNAGDTECTEHHMLVVPRSILASGIMDSEDYTDGGYLDSGFRKGTNRDGSANGTLAAVEAMIKEDFGEINVLSHRQFLKGKNGETWTESTVDLMNEWMAFGFSASREYSIDKTQLQLFALRPDLLTIRQRWLLRDVPESGRFSCMGTYGQISSIGAAAACGIRPVFAIH